MESNAVKKVRWGILSTAKIARQQVIPATQAASNCEVVAIASRDAKRAQAVAEDLQIPRSYGSYEELIHDTEVDAVYIPVPNHLHAEWTIKAAQAGKHVLCEKPLAMNSSQAQEMADACDAAGVHFMEAFMYRLHPAWVHTVEMIEAGRIGQLRAVQSVFSYFNRDPENIRNFPEMGGGALMDIGCYSINLSRMLFGAEPISVQASVHLDPEFGVDTLTSAVLGFAGGGQSTFTCGTQLQPAQRVLILGSKGEIEIEVPFNPPTDSQTRILLTSNTTSLTGDNSEVITFAPANHYTAQAEVFAEAVITGSPVPLPPSDGVANMAVIDTILASG